MRPTAAIAWSFFMWPLKRLMHLKRLKRMLELPLGPYSATKKLASKPRLRATGR